MYQLLIKRRAERDLRLLPPSVYQRIHAAILSLREEPRPPGSSKLVGDLTG